MLWLARSCRVFSYFRMGVELQLRYAGLWPVWLGEGLSEVLPPGVGILGFWGVGAGGQLGAM